MAVGPRLYLLDTNTVGYIVSGRSRAARSKLKEALQQSTVAISTISQAEIYFGFENKPEATRLKAATVALLNTVERLSWDEQAAMAYGRLRKDLAAAGKSLTAMDLLIAAHATAAGAVLVTRDKAFLQAKALLEVVDWATDL